MIRKIPMFFLALFGVLNSVNAATYYLQSGSASSPEVPASWNTNINGGGTSASSFPVNTGDVFVIPAGVSATLSNSWTFGSSSKPSTGTLNILGSLSIADAISLTITQKNTDITTINVESGGSLIFQGTGASQLDGGTVAQNLIVNINSGANINTKNASGLISSGGTTSINTANLTINLNSGFNYELSGANQTMGLPVSVTSINNLTFSGSGTKTLYSQLTTIANNFSLSGTATTTALGAFTIGGSVSIGTGTTFVAGSFTHNVAGDWTNTGTFTTAGTVNFNGSASQTINSSNFNHIQFVGTGTKTLAGTITVNGNWTNSGTIAPGTSTVSFNSASTQTITESGSGGFYNLTLNGSGLKSIANNTTVLNQITLTSGLLDIAGYNLTAGSFSGGSSSSYIKTSGTGKLKQTLNLNATKNFPVGNSAYNPIELTNNQESPSGEFNVRVSDEAVTNSNNPSMGVNRRWYVTETAAGDVNVTAKMTYNTGEQGASFNAATNPGLAIFNGTFWNHTSATVNGNQFSATVTLTDSSTYPDQYLTIGSGDAFNATKFSISMNPVNPNLGVANTVIHVTTLNSNNVETCVSQATGVSLSVANTTTSPATLTGSIAANTHDLIISSVAFTTVSYNATLTATRTSGDNITASTSAIFSVIAGDMYEPLSSGNFNDVTWRKSVDGGVNWSATTLPAGNVFGETDMVSIPAGISTVINTSVSLYSILVIGNLDLTTGGTLTLNHPAGNTSGIDLHVHGTFKNSGGDFVNNDGTNGTTYPIEIHGGTYWHARNGGEIPNALWETLNTTVSNCKVTGITTTALTGGLNQNFQKFEWDNAFQAVSQSLSGNLHISDSLKLTNGVITTGSNYTIEAATGTVTRTNGWINGNFRYYIPNTINANVLFPVGDVNYYTPVSVTFSGTTSGSGYVDVRTDAGIPPMSSGLSQIKYVNRKWTVVSSGVNYSSYSISLTYNANDLVGSPNTANLLMRRISNNTWFNSGGSASGTTFTATEQTTFSDFYIGEDDCFDRYVWFGSTSTDWNTASNWCKGVVPNRAIDVYIPGGIAVYPSVANFASCRNLELTSGATLNTSTGSLYVYGNVANEGAIVCGDTLGFIGAANQTVSGAGTISLNHLSISNTGGLTSSSGISVNGQLYLGTANQSDVAGCLDMSNGSTLTMGENSSTTGTGDVSGIIRREHAFSSNVDYSFGNQYTTVNFFGTGTKPTWLECKVQIGTSPITTTAVKRKYFFKVNATGYTDFITVKLHFLTSELNGNYASKLVLFDDHNGFAQHEHGYSDRDSTNNWISLSGKSIGYLATATGTKYYYLNNTVDTRNSWIGVSDTWNDAANWSSGHAPNSTTYITDNVYIPAGKSRYPLITDNITVNSLEIADGANFSAGSNTITVTGGTNAWHDGTGGFNYGTSTVAFNNASLDSIVQIIGTAYFYNMSVGSTTFIQAQSGNVINLYNSYLVNTGGKVDLVSKPNTIVIRTTSDFTLINPTDGVHNGFYSLKLDQTSGTVTFPTVINLKGNLTINGAFAHNNGTVYMDGTTEQLLDGSFPYVLKNLQIDNVAGVRVNAGDSISVAGTMTINPGKKLSINPGSQITVNSIVNNAGSAGLVLESAAGQPNATLKFSNSAANPVAATVQMYSKAYAATNVSGAFSDYQWQYVGVPVDGLTKSFQSLSGSYIAQFNDASLNGWEVVPSALSPFRGYTITQSVARTIEWTGNLYNQSQTIQIPSHFVSDVQTPSGGFHLLANSFTSAVYIRDINFGSIGTDYVIPTVYLFNTGKATSSATGTDDTPGQYWAIPQNQAGTNGLPNSISSLQGFFVQAGSTSTTAFVTLPYSSSIVNNYPMKVKAETLPNDIELAIELKSDHAADKIWLFRNASTTPDFDAGWDGEKLAGNEGLASISVAGLNKDYQVFTSNELNNTMINFTNGIDSLYTLNFKFNPEKLAETAPLGLYLVDTYTGKKMKLVDEYTPFAFTAEKNAPLQRFKIEFAESVNTEIENIEKPSLVKIKVLNGELSLQNNSLSSCDYRILDLSGRILKTGKTVPNSEESIFQSETNHLIIVQTAIPEEITNFKIALK